VENEVREQWNKLATTPPSKVSLPDTSIRIDVRLTPEWAGSKDELRGRQRHEAADLSAARKQETGEVHGPGTRGFRDVLIDCSSGQVTSNIFGTKRKQGPVLKIVEKDIALSVDPWANTAQRPDYLSNPTDKELFAFP
jgi:hypothetical protein